MPQNICFSRLQLDAGQTNRIESENSQRVISTRIGGNSKWITISQIAINYFAITLNAVSV